VKVGEHFRERWVDVFCCVSSLIYYCSFMSFQALLEVSEKVGEHFGERWVDVLRCVSRWELLQQLASGQPTDAALFHSRQSTGEDQCFL
jgi:hypothetical protein